jgi:hypothetical protein
VYTGGFSYRGIDWQWFQGLKNFPDPPTLGFFNKKNPAEKENFRNFNGFDCNMGFPTRIRMF